MLIHELVEARRNPKQNPRITIHQAVRDHHAAHSNDRMAGMPNSWVSFTQVNKLGINPRRSHTLTHMPLAVYAYPSQLVLDTHNVRELFGGYRPWAMIFDLEPHARVRDITDSGSDIVRGVTDLLSEQQRAAALSWLEDNPNQWARWALMIGEKYLSQRWRISAQVAQNKMMRMLDIDAVVDPGQGWLTQDLPQQLVVFNISCVNRVQAVPNTSQPDVVDAREFVDAVLEVWQQDCDWLSHQSEFVGESKHWLSACESWMQHMLAQADTAQGYAALRSWLGQEFEQFIKQLHQHINNDQLVSELDRRFKLRIRQVADKWRSS